MKLSARNQIPGKVVSVKNGAVMTEVVVDIGGHQLVSVISTGAANELALAPGTKVFVVVKSTEVMIGLPDPVKM
jgi:molybdopterin-binding protein